MLSVVYVVWCIACKRGEKDVFLLYADMNSLKAFVWRFARQKMVGILSVAIGIAAPVGIWVINEFTFDCFSENREQIYRSHVKLC